MKKQDYSTQAQIERYELAVAASALMTNVVRPTCVSFQKLRCLMACPHLFPKHETLCPERDDFVAVFAVSGYDVSCFGNKCGRGQAFTRLMSASR